MHRPFRSRLRVRGLTLIELITAVAIVGILAGIAWPLFEEQLQKNRRKEGISLLMQAAQEMHQCRTDNGSYTGCAPATTSSAEGNYDVTSAITGGGEGFTLTADRVAGEDAKCEELIIDHLGRKSFTGSATTTNECWGE